ncbi:MAG: restriction endonuclease [Candidatus Omnitrophica bacterium]|nr:restriction endonuclease [Candidatus Omnitrophota bacterium]
MSRKNSKAEFVKWLGPLLDALRDLGDSGKPREVSNKIAENLSLPDDLLDEILKSGINKFHNQVAWARRYLVWEGLLDSSKYGTWKLTEEGKKTHLNDEEARNIFLKWVEIYQRARKEKESSKIIEDQEEKTPEEYQKETPADLLYTLQNLSPSGFEKICKELLREHGFDNVVVTGASHDGGIDGYGTLELNPFVSFKVIFQCKKYQGSVSRAQVGDFRNAMIGRAEKGIILTTGSFTSEAIKEANREGAPPIELVDGNKLIEMFEKVELGVNAKVVYEVDVEYFKKYIDE